MSKNIKKNQTISIMGATSTGKTSLSLKVAAALLEKKKFSKIHLISADSRQVYKGLNILTGADLPEKYYTKTKEVFVYPFYTNSEETIFLHGINLINPNDEWSVAHFKKLFENIKKNLKKDELIILVGGTPFYHQQISSSAETISIKPDWELRKELEKKELKDLQNILKKSDTQKLESMNNSDRNNPRRLIRAIEVAQNKEKIVPQKENEDILKIYLDLNLNKISEKIKKRVSSRFEDALKEIETLKNKNFDWEAPAFSSTGTQYLIQYLNKDISKEECLQMWAKQELQYAKRQITWWKKEKDLNKIQIDNENILEKSLSIIKEFID